MKSSRWLLLTLLLTLLCAFILASTPSNAQLVVVDKKLVVTQVRPGHHEIGVTTPPNPSETRNWVKVEPNTHISYKLRRISRSELWRLIRPGMVMRVHGGRDWNDNIVAHDIWL